MLREKARERHAEIEGLRHRTRCCIPWPVAAARDKKKARGIAPKLLVSQVRNTAAWLWDDERAANVTSLFDRFAESERTADNDDDVIDYLRLLLSAHWATVGTFVPTDVDVRIRHHTWVDIEDPRLLERACAIIDDVAGLSSALVSARVIASEKGALSGHDGEWFSVRAGALGRAVALGAADAVDRLSSAIDAELDREAALFEEAVSERAAPRLLAIATTVAHNTGDLSRVVEAWPKHPGLEDFRARYSRLGHPDAKAPRRAFVLAGVLNKALVAHENHRFLPLRRPRALRTSRALLLPFGPWFDAWGETIATSPLLEERDRGEVVEALLDVHLSRPEELGCLRALAGIHRKAQGGLDKLVPLLPARMRKDALRGRVREALDITPDHFAARMDRRLRTELEKLG